MVWQQAKADEEGSKAEETKVPQETAQVGGLRLVQVRKGSVAACNLCWVDNENEDRALQLKSEADGKNGKSEGENNSGNREGGRKDGSVGVQVRVPEVPEFWGV